MIHFEPQTLAKAYKQLADGEEGFRVAIGEFMNSFFLYHREDRQALLDEAPQIPGNPTQEQRGWAAFCAGAAEYLAERYGLQCPPWAQCYRMSEPWYIVPCEDQPGLKADFQETAPEPFRQRNVFCSDRVFSNPHPSSREPGSLFDMARRRAAMLASMPEEQRGEYIRRYNARMPKALQLTAKGELATPEQVAG